MPRARLKSAFVCDSCGNETPKWEGRCPACSEWNTLFEVAVADRVAAVRADITSTPARELSQVSTRELPRIELSLDEFNRVLGGGVVPGSLALLYGEPGIGKSTLLLQLAADVSASHGQTLYVSGEESAPQVKMRADRLGIDGRGLFLLPETNLSAVLARLDAHRPALVVVDSIQTLHDDSLTAAPGSVAQIRECAQRLMEWVKATGTPAFLSGHVTKEGDVAGPRLLEHLVDVVLYMEGDANGAWRLLRSTKNRFGSTNEICVFDMAAEGLKEVRDPSRTFLAGRTDGAIGSVIVATMKGSRPMLVEVQALTMPSMLPQPRRVATGIDFNRLLLVCAVMSRHAGVALAGQDIVVNVAGGVRLSEPAGDLGVALAIASSLKNQPIAPGIAVVGELGLTGEVRAVSQLERRAQEVARLGLGPCIGPGGPDDDERPRAPGGPAVSQVRTLAEALRLALPPQERAQVRPQPAGAGFGSQR